MQFVKDFFWDVMVDRSDKFAVMCAAGFLVILTLLTNPSLREFSTTLSLICLIGLLWRVIGSFPRLTPLSLTLSVALILTLASGALAQYLLTRQIVSLPSSHQPSNTVGITVVLFGRMFIIYAIIRWTALLNRWDRRVSGNVS